MGVKSELFGCTKDGKTVQKYILENQNGMRAEILNFGGVVANLWVPDKTGALQDVVLGYNTVADYERADTHFGEFVGRVANRIENARFTLDNTSYRLVPNDGKNHLHGTFGRMLFTARPEANSVVLHAVSPDGDDGFPGNLDVTVTYTLTDDNALVMDYTATTDAPTLVNLTNHSYFNLDGCASPSILEQTLCIAASHFTEGNAEICPTGRILPVAGTPMDFTQAKPIGQDIDAAYTQLTQAGGYDHNYVLDKALGEMGLAAVAKSEKTGIVMETYTTQPGIQLYTGNFLASDPCLGKAGKHQKNQAFCLETQHFPCAPSHPEFPSIVLRPGQVYHQVTSYRFKVDA